jgi:hypothetical protein
MSTAFRLARFAGLGAAAAVLALITTLSVGAMSSSAA